MAENTLIEWADHTFNPWIGCTKVSPGCDHCYAERREDLRLHRVQWGAGKPRQRTKTWRDPIKWNERAAVDGKRYRVFCASLADVFDNEVDPAWRRDLFDLIESTPNIDWLLLTKRIGNVAAMVEASAPFHRLASNVWLGATIVNQAEADRDVPKLLSVPARVRFLSIEPMLGAVDLHDHLMHQINGFTPSLHWVICGGESGPHARPMHPSWARSLRDQCKAAGVPFHFKQHGEWLPTAFCDDAMAMLPSRRTVYVKPDGSYVQLGDAVDFFGNVEETAWVGKAAAGRLLDGIEHNGFPT